MISITETVLNVRKTSGACSIPPVPWTSKPAINGSAKEAIKPITPAVAHCRTFPDRLLLANVIELGTRRLRPPFSN
jgi:hypothetical protein